MVQLLKPLAPKPDAEFLPWIHKVKGDLRILVFQESFKTLGFPLRFILLTFPFHLTLSSPPPFHHPCLGFPLSLSLSAPAWSPLGPSEWCYVFCHWPSGI